MKVTVYMPTYNRLDLFKTALGSALTQEWHDMEILVFVNGCTDGTFEWLGCIGDPRVRVVKSEINIRDPNTIIDLSHGELVCFLHDDDTFYDRESVKCRAECFERDPELEVLYASARNIYQNGREHSITHAEPPDRDRVRAKEYTHWPTYMWKKSIHERIGRFPVQLKYQNDRWFKTVSMMECKCMALDKIVYQYMIWGGQDSARANHSGDIVADSVECSRLLKERYG